MILIFGIVAIVIFTIQVFKSANGTGRNGGLWALLTAGLGFGLQFVLPFVVGIVVAIGYLATGTPVDNIERDIQTPAAIIGIVGFILSIAAMFIIWKFVSRVRDDVPSAVSAPPPPPPTFGQ